MDTDFTSFYYATIVDGVITRGAAPIVIAALKKGVGIVYIGLGEKTAELETQKPMSLREATDAVNHAKKELIRQIF